MIINVSLTGQTVVATAPPLAEESINKLFCSLSVDAEWDGLSITLIFRLVHRLGTITRSAIVTDLTSVPVPPEVIKEGYLYIGAIGVANGGAVRLTTAVMRTPLKLSPAEDDNVDPAGSVTITIADQILATLGGLQNLMTETKSSLVAAINEVLGRCLPEVSGKDTGKVLLVAEGGVWTAGRISFDGEPLPDALSAFADALELSKDHDSVSAPVFNPFVGESGAYQIATCQLTAAEAEASTEEGGYINFPSSGTVEEMIAEAIGGIENGAY